MDNVGNFATPLRSFFKIGLNKIFKRYYEKYLSASKVFTSEYPAEVDYISGADLFLRKSVLDKVGLYDEQFFMYGEEADLCYRIKQQGYNIRYVPQAKIIHLVGQSIKKNKKNIEKIKIHNISELLYFKKHFGEPNVLFLKVLFTLKYLYKYLFSFDSVYLSTLSDILRV